MSHQDFHDSSSPAPSSVRDIQIPDDSLIIQYSSVDPTRVLDNPSHLFGDTFYDCNVSEKVGSMLIELLESYQRLSNANMAITLQTIKTQLMTEEMKNSDIYSILDKFYVDVPDISCVTSTWVNADALPFLLAKQELHQGIKEKLKQLQTVFDTLKKTSTKKNTENEEQDYSDEEVQHSKKKKNKKSKVKTSTE
jgi:hypothetical protein